MPRQKIEGINNGLQVKVYTCVKHNPNFTYPTISAIVGENETDVEVELLRLAEKGEIELTGNDTYRLPGNTRQSPVKEEYIRQFPCLRLETHRKAYEAICNEEVRNGEDLSKIIGVNRVRGSRRITTLLNERLIKKPKQKQEDGSVIISPPYEKTEAAPNPEEIYRQEAIVLQA